MDSPEDAEQIRAEMARIRSGLHREVDDLVESARTMTDYRYYLKRYPWACVAGAVAVGYLVVPNKTKIISPDAETLEKLARQNKLLVKSQADFGKQKPGPLNMLLTLAANSLIRAGMSYAGQQAGKLFAEPPADRASDGSPVGSTRESSKW